MLCLRLGDQVGIQPAIMRRSFDRSERTFWNAHGEKPTGRFSLCSSELCILSKDHSSGLNVYHQCNDSSVVTPQINVCKPAGGRREGGKVWRSVGGLRYGRGPTLPWRIATPQPCIPARGLDVSPLLLHHHHHLIQRLGDHDDYDGSSKNSRLMEQLDVSAPGRFEV